MRKITEIEYMSIIQLYHDWKSLNNRFKLVSNRGLNLHEYITEGIICYLNDFSINNHGGADSADAISDMREKIQIKGSSNFEGDLSSFGPDSIFDRLFYCGLQQNFTGNLSGQVLENKDILWIWEIPVNLVYSVNVKAGVTFLQRQQEGKRPRFSIYQKIILPNNLIPTKYLIL